MGITVTGFGRASGTPDVIELELGVSVLADGVEEARGTAAEKTQAIRRELMSAGVTEADLATSRYTIQTEHDYSGQGERLLGYRVTNVVRARLRDLSRAGEVVDLATAAGGDHATVGGIRFDIADPAGLEREARGAAWSQAHDKATQLAELSGHVLGAATSITETVQAPVQPMRLMAGAAMAEAAPTPLQGGSTEITVTLEVEFALAPERE